MLRLTASWSRQHWFGIWNLNSDWFWLCCSSQFEFEWDFEFNNKHNTFDTNRARARQRGASHGKRTAVSSASSMSGVFVHTYITCLINSILQTMRLGARRGRVGLLFLRSSQLSQNGPEVLLFRDKRRWQQNCRDQDIARVRCRKIKRRHKWLTSYKII